jgi:hypothetical protein
MSRPRALVGWYQDGGYTPVEPGLSDIRSIHGPINRAIGKTEKSATIRISCYHMISAANS